MRIEKDYEKLFVLLNKHDVKYCVIGGFAFALYAYPRYTKDIDILVESSQENATKILEVLKEFGFGSLDLKEEDFTTPGQIIQLGYEPMRIDFIMEIQGLSFDEIWQTRNQQAYGKENVWFISLENLIKAKKLANRPHDQADVADLIKVRKRK